MQLQGYTNNSPMEPLKLRKTLWGGGRSPSSLMLQFWDELGPTSFKNDTSYSCCMAAGKASWVQSTWTSSLKSLMEFGPELFTFWQLLFSPVLCIVIHLELLDIWPHFVMTSSTPSIYTYMYMLVYFSCLYIHVYACIFFLYQHFW